MTNREKKAWLSRYLPLMREIRALCEEYEQVMSLGVRMTPVYSDMPKASGGVDHVQGAVDRLTAIAEVARGKAEQLEMLRGEIMAAVETVRPETLRELLYRRYIRGETFEEIAYKLGYQWRWTIVLHGRALEALRIPENRTC